jgi:hypothetical protein
MKKRLGAIALSVTMFMVSLPPRANAQAAAVVIPAGAAIVIIGGLAWYYWVTQSGEHYSPAPMPATSGGYTENPDDEGEWGVFRARDAEHCNYLAAGRPHRWLGNGKCEIKG